MGHDYDFGVAANPLQQRLHPPVLASDKNVQLPEEAPLQVRKVCSVRLSSRGTP
jgi:hypothetical protein